MISGNDSVCAKISNFHGMQHKRKYADLKMADEESLLPARMKLAEINFGQQVASDMRKTYKKFAVNFVAYRKL